MCGIAGICGLKRVRAREAVVRMSEMLIHRGPDGEGWFEDDALVLVHRRLAIIDLEGGAQPLHSRDGRYVLIANGEIYNHVELREEMERDGYRFSTRSDCEVILPLFIWHGVGCVHRLRGMFAFTLWDRVERKLYLVRDRMGEKPLYYSISSGGLVFASELRAILESGLVSRRVNADSIREYFLYQFVPEPRTPVSGVHKLPAGYMMVYEADTRHMRLERYWSLAEAEPVDANPAAVIRERLREAMRIVLRSDVPVGIALSGGVDSSAISCLAADAGYRNMTAITAGYRDAGDVDERRQAGELARRLGMDFLDVEITDDMMLDDFETMVMQRDDPIGDIAGYGYYRVMQKAHEAGIRVMLQGHGIDELFWGYPWVRDSVRLNEAGLELFRAGNGGRLISRLFSRMKAVLSSGVADRMRFFDLTPFNRYVMANSSRMFSGPVLQGTDVESLLADFRFENIKERVDIEITRLIVDYYLTENGITQGDRLAMAHSVEMRLPYLDYEFVQAAIGLRKASRDDGLPPKARFREAMKGIVPDEILERRKQGFTPPVERWQRRLADVFGSQLRDGLLVQTGILDRGWVEEILEPGVRGPAATVGRMALVLEIWCRRAGVEGLSGEPCRTLAAEG